MTDCPLYHGGARRLDRKGVILPPSRTGASCASDYGAAGVHRRDRVYLTSSLESARLFALLAPPDGEGDVYEVAPIGGLERDPDYIGPPDEQSYTAPLARIVRVVERRVRTMQGLTRDEVVELFTPDGDRPAASERLVSLAILGGAR